MPTRAVDLEQLAEQVETLRRAVGTARWETTLDESISRKVRDWLAEAELHMVRAADQLRATAKLFTITSSPSPEKESVPCPPTIVESVSVQDFK